MNGEPADGQKAWLALKSKNQSNSRQRGRTLLHRLDNNVIKADTNSDTFRSEVCQLRDELNDLDEVVSTERLTAINVDALPDRRYLAIINVQASRYPDLSLK